MRTGFLYIPLVAVLTAAAGPAAAQGLPTSQPNYLTIFREEVKPGRNVEHSKLEAGWPAAYQKAGSPDYYLGLASMTGPNEAWFLGPQESFAKAGESMQRDESDPVLSAELARLSKADGELLSGWQALQLVGRKDLSYGAYPNLAKARFWEISTWRMKPGQDAAFEAAAKAYGAAAERSVPGMSYRVYQVIAGGFEPTFMVISSVESYGDFDRTMASGQTL